jgi:fumarate hydratase class II
VERLGYAVVEDLIAHAASSSTTLRMAAVSRGLLTEADFDALVAPGAVNRLGSRT